MRDLGHGYPENSSARLPLEVLADGLHVILYEIGGGTSIDVAIKLERYLTERGWTLTKGEKP